ncbi:MAG TPA: divalent metal cation transporter [Actinomycetales bacterium]|nr:divalent metal cation transporter [Actinomycetales bacterium]
MKRVFMLTLGVMTAIGGFVDIGNLVTSGVTGARFDVSLAWAVALGTIGMVVYGEMAGRVTAVAQRPVFHVVRERLGVRFGLLNLVAACALSALALTAEIGGVALSLELASDVSYLLWVPLVALGVWGVTWRMKFQYMERIFGLMGLALLVFVVALFFLPTDWGALLSSATHPSVPASESYPTYFFYAVSLVGACIVPYQVVFFSAGGLEEGWTVDSLAEMRLNVLVGFPLGGILTLAIMACSAVVLMPLQVNVSHLGEVGLPAAVAFGKAGLAFALVGFFAATFAAAAETALSTGYSMGQYFGWSWGKWLRPTEAPRFHVVVLGTLLLGTAFVLTTIDPIKVTIVSVVLGAAAIPLTYLPILVTANDRDYLGEHVNGWFANALGVLVLLMMLVVSLVAVPLLLWTKAGQ